MASLNRLAFSATLHCLTGCAIGEILGLVIATALGWGNGASIAVAVVAEGTARVQARGRGANVILYGDRAVEPLAEERAEREVVPAEGGRDHEAEDLADRAAGEAVEGGREREPVQACHGTPPVSQPTRLCGEIRTATRSSSVASSGPKAAGVSESMSISPTTLPS